MTTSENDYLRHFTEGATLYIRGALPEIRNFTVAIVGTRKPTEYGARTAYKTAYELVRQGVTVISGLALGIDAAAHRGALDGATLATSNTGFVPTIAVLASGVNNVTPRQNQGLSEQILSAGGAILSEYPDEKPNSVKAWQLLARNRIVSGLADAVIIVEAAARSGTSSTARHAMKQGRPVFIVPGRLTDVMSAGCLELLEEHPDKVRIFTTVNKLLGATRLNDHEVKVASASLEPSCITTKAKDMIRAGSTSTEIAKRLEIGAAELAQIQTELELFG
ncbi:DNA-protecting protein DprA [Candidatus Saccharibacteria bacterium]|nr:DNA-protecting protein DprA [Candidatus Saccharibacteria bacterium]